MNTTYLDNGNYIFSLNATYGSNAESIEFQVNVNNPNRAPVLAAIGSKAGAEGSQLDISLSATDADGDAITYSYSCSAACPAGMNLVSNTFSWTPTNGQAGSYTVTFMATDDGVPVLTDTETITISVTNTNNSPVLSAVGNKTVAEGSLLSIPLSAPDVNGDTITYSHSCSVACPAGMSLTTNTFSWTPDYGQAGTYTVTFTATDDGSPVLTDSETITITVTNTNRAPNEYVNIFSVQFRELKIKAVRLNNGAMKVIELIITSTNSNDQWERTLNEKNSISCISKKR